MIPSRNMTTRGKHLAATFAVIVLFFLPKHVDCGYPGAACKRDGVFRQVCTAYEVEPLGLWLIENLASRDVGFAYSSGEACR